MQKQILILLVMMAIVVAYSIISLNSTNGLEFGYNEIDNLSKTVDDNAQENSDELNQHSANVTVSPSTIFSKISNITAAGKEATLPFDITVVGISLPSKEKNYDNNDESLVIIKFENDLFEHNLYDYILDTKMQIVKIEALQISVMYEETPYIIALTPPNILAEDFRAPDKSYAELIEMTADEIGSRPRIMEHLLAITPTPYIANGVIVGPGINPALFNQAGFQIDDVLKTINGKSLTVESELEDIKEELKTAQTLTFVVIRKGRQLTLYLDIPSEGLNVSRD